jgi:hypothetical protein
MVEYIFSLWGMIVIAIVCSTLATIVATVAKQWRLAREADLEASLKADLVAQGRSADEIERVLMATGRIASSDDDE